MNGFATDRGSPIHLRKGDRLHQSLYRRPERRRLELRLDCSRQLGSTITGAIKVAQRCVLGWI